MADEVQYDPGEGLNEYCRMLRHHPLVVAHMVVKAQEALAMCSDNYDYFVQNRDDTTRARVWMHPINNEGIHEELSESLLIKAAINMQGR
jgi:hypothetical protein